MPTIDIIDLNRRKVGAAELRPEVFGVEVKTSIPAGPGQAPSGPQCGAMVGSCLGHTLATTGTRFPKGRRGGPCVRPSLAKSGTGGC